MRRLLSSCWTQRSSRAEECLISGPRRFESTGVGFTLALSQVLSACDTAAPPRAQDGPTRHSVAEPCGDPATFPPQGTLGQRIDDAFHPYVEAEPVKLQYGSQLGIGLGVVVEMNDLDLSEVERIEVDLRVEEESLGFFGVDSPRLTCQQGFSYFEAMVMLNVLGHPTVASVAQLDGRQASVELRVFSEDELLIEGAATVLLEL